RHVAAVDVSRRLELTGEMPDECLEPGRARPVTARADDDEVPLRTFGETRECLSDGVGRLRGLRIPHDVRVRGQPVQRGRDEAESEEDGDSPERECPTRVGGRRASETPGE